MKTKLKDHITNVKFYRKLYYLWLKSRKKRIFAGNRNCCALEDDV